jgi:hypothetical protein
MTNERDHKGDCGDYGEPVGGNGHVGVGAQTIEYSLLGVRDTTGSNAKISLAYLVHPTGLTTAFAAGK